MSKAGRQKAIEIAKKCEKCILKEQLTKDSEGKEWVKIILKSCPKHAKRIFQVQG